MKNDKILRTPRYVLLLVFLMLITVKAYLHKLLGDGEAPSIHALCPFMD
ncbi:hypothetical protein [Clostridium kluyveri]|nr:hypothetical protein [Clostridium kluyveri]